MKFIFILFCFVSWIFCQQDPDEFPEKLARALKEVKKKVSPSIVAIYVKRKSDEEAGGGPLRVHKEYFRRPNCHVPGVIISKDGYIITSAFNVAGEIKSIEVIHKDKSYEAKLLGYSKPLDVALLKIEADGLAVLETLSADEIKQGLFVAVVARGPEKSNITITNGIISAVGRFNGTAVQTDALINYANSGGALVDMDGKLIGIITHVKPMSPWGQSGGVGFATKMTEINKILDRLKKGEKIEKPKKPWIGVTVEDADEEIKGARVSMVFPNSPADKAGIKMGDIIYKVDQKKIKNADDLKQFLRDKKIGDKIKIKVKRFDDEKNQWQEKEFEITLEESP